MMETDYKTIKEGPSNDLNQNSAPTSSFKNCLKKRNGSRHLLVQSQEWKQKKV